ncbi:TetR/AcrR family transcriptional regulator [Oenococcus sicerae]|uniref:TetR/AcrR family transcriptional regulator n=1 Tax=Oenococcus sicerae TaxID=2203724 RepID=A0AAJ1R929_9LACO|nr:TetR/AcrR family transcriptional regulator [Oenococcus sicerae]MDN6900318.1 TetR/AcrR family transcriptional regulator [Oenococcus sicerae]QAS69894.1 TetR/AcrR family transcriptional regulator [Oenococcus sicerae]
MLTNAEVRAKRNIQMSFIELLKKQPSDTITIKLITTKALINRSTFYRYYQDKDFLIADTFSFLLQRIIEQNPNDNTPKEFISSIVMYVHDHGAFMKNLTVRNRAASIPLFVNMIANLFLSADSIPNLNTTMQSNIKALFIKSKTPEYMAYMLAGGMVSVLYKWMNADMLQEPNTVINLLMELVDLTNQI